MDVRVVLQLAPPCMKHSEKAWQITSDIFGVGSEFFHGFGRCLKHGSIGNTLVAADEAPQMLWFGTVKVIMKW